MVVGAVAQGAAESKKAKQANANQKAATKDEARYGAILSQFDKEQDYYYRQVDKQERMRGLDQFKKFSSLHTYAPEFVDTNTGPVVPEKPDANKLFPEEAQAAKKKKRSFLGKLADPAGIMSDSMANKLGDPAGLMGG